MALKLVEGPAVEPVTLAEAKLHCRVDVDDDDDLITTYIQAAREYAETVTRRALITQTWDYYRDGFPSGDTLKVPLPALQSVAGVYYTPDGGSEQTLDSDDYEVDTVSEPGRIVLARGASWPGDVLTRINGVRVRFTAGYGDAASDVPGIIKLAMKLLIGHWYENREATVAVGNIREVPLPVDTLLWSRRVMSFGSGDED